MTSVAPAASPGDGGQHRQPIIAAAVELTVSAGWSAVTMSRLAGMVGVSRQTVYNEIGSKTALAEAMVAHELARFLSVVDAAFKRHPEDLAEAVYDSVRAVLELADDNVLLRAVVSATHGTNTDLLPLLTTRADALLTQAKAVLNERARAYAPQLDDRQFDTVIDMVVRTVLSHVMQPSDTPIRTADALAWAVTRLTGTPRPDTMRSRS